MKETKKIKDNQLEKVSGGMFERDAVPVHETTFWEKFKNFFGFGKKEETRGKQEGHIGNFLDDKGVYHINCIKCGKELRSFTPAPGSMYACGPQVCDECKEAEKKL